MTGWVLDESGRLKRETIPRMGRRLRGWDYKRHCISQGEREIARRAFEGGFSVITLANKGFSPLYKPGGKLFETCANGKLLMLAPIGCPHQVAEKPITRIDALILNRIAQLIAGDGAAKIDYKGVSMTGIDEGVIKVTSENE